jgi:DNA primase
LTQQQVAIMARYVPEVVMNYDPDAAGQNAMRRSIDLLLAKGLRVRVLKLSGGLDPDDFVRKEGGEVYSRLLANAPYFWQYLMAEAARQYDLEQPAMKANAVNDVMQHVAKIEDRIEQLEVARAVAEGFKLPESVVFEKLHLTPRRPNVRPVVRNDAVTEAERKLSEAEKQLIQALLQSQDMARALEPRLQGEFMSEVWSAAVLEKLVKEPGASIEMALEGVQDEQLRRQVRALAVLDPTRPISLEEAFSSVRRLNDAYIVKKIGEIQVQLKQYGSGPAPAELIEKHQKFVREITRTEAFKA